MKTNPYLKQRLTQALDSFLELGFAITPLLGNKAPYRNNWQHEEPLSKSALIREINSGRSLGLGIRTGAVSGGIVAVDLDGASATPKILELSGNRDLPRTVAFTSGRIGQCQYIYRVNSQYRGSIQTKKIKTGVVGDDGKSEQVELRWDGCQSVLPPSVHPMTGEYKWVEGCAPSECEIAIAPLWLIELMLVDPSATQQQSQPQIPIVATSPISSYKQIERWTNIDWALSYLQALAPNRADDYDEWLAVGMALHSVDDSLLREWDAWSQQSSKYKPGVCEVKWKSFKRTGVSIGSLAHMAKSDGWTTPFEKSDRTLVEQRSLTNSKRVKEFGAKKIGSPSTQQNNSLRTTDQPNKATLFFQASPPSVTGDTPTSSDTSSPSAATLSTTVTTVTSILEQGLPEWEEHSKLDALQSGSGISKTSFAQLVASRRCQSDEVMPSDEQQLERLIDWKNVALDFNKVIPHMADDLLHDGRILNIDPIMLWQYLFPAVLSMLGSKANLIVGSHATGAIAWTCIVGESGIGKSRAESIILAPLKAWQKAEYDRFKSEWAEYKKSLHKKSDDNNSPQEPPPSERKFLFAIATIQAVMRRLSEQGQNGSLWARDEIAGLFKSLGQFTAKGEGKGLECLLPMWDGAPAPVDRVQHDDSYHVQASRLSIAGGLQPGVFRKIFSDPDDAQGIQARFLFALPKVQPCKRVKGYCHLSEKLPQFYHWVDTQFPHGNIKLSTAADARYDAVYESIGQQAESASCPAVRAWMRKLPGQLLRIALALHVIECYHESSRPRHELQVDTLNRAVDMCLYYSSTFEVVQESVSDSDCVSSILLKIWDLAATSPQGLAVRDAYRSIKALARRAKEQGRNVAAYTTDLYYQLEKMGKGSVQKAGRLVRFVVGGSKEPPTQDPGSDPKNPPDSPIDTNGMTNLAKKNQGNLETKQTRFGTIATDKEGQECGDKKMVERLNHKDYSYYPPTTQKNVPPFSKPCLPRPDFSSLASVTEVTEDQAIVTQGFSVSPPDQVSLVTQQKSLVDMHESETDVQPFPVGLDTLVSMENISRSDPSCNESDDAPGVPILTQVEPVSCAHNIPCGNDEMQLPNHAEIQSWLNRIASVQTEDECMDCMDALSQLPPLVNELIFSNAKNLLPRFWEILNSSLPRTGSGLCNQVLHQQQPNQNCLRIIQTPGVDNSVNNATSFVKNLIAGLWVRTRDGFYGHLAAMQTDGRWWVKSPKSKTRDAESRLYDASDIIPMPSS